MDKIYNNPGFYTLPVRLVIGWTYYSAFWRRTILENKLNPDLAGYVGEKFNHFLPNALGIKPVIQYLLEHPDLLWINMIIFTIIEGLVGLFLLFGLFTRLMGLGAFSLAMGILLGSGWIGTTCLDEWQIGVLGIATGFMLFLTGSGQYSLDHYLIKNGFKITKRKWFAWVGSGPIPIPETSLSKLVITGAIVLFGITLFTNQVFHGGLYGKLHNKSVKPKLEITEGAIKANELSFNVFRTEGVDVYGSWVITIALVDSNDNTILSYDQKALSRLTEENLINYYIAKVKAGKYSLLIPLGAKAKLILPNDALLDLPEGKYTLRITDISGAYWEQSIEK